MAYNSDNIKSRSIARAQEYWIEVAKIMINTDFMSACIENQWYEIKWMQN